MMGMARNVKGGNVREYEFTLLRQEPNGDILFVASPSKQTETTFKAIEGPGRDGKPRRVEYPYKRVKP